jgi:hypothetical protein
MPRKNRYGDHLKEWETMDTALRNNAAELPQLAGAHEKLQELLAELQDLLAQAAMQRASKQHTSKRLVVVSAKGRKAATSIRAVLKEYYGHTNQKLWEFGIQPLRTRSRTAEPEPQPEQPEPPSPPVE